MQWRPHPATPVALSGAGAIVTLPGVAQDELWRSADMNRLDGKVALVSGAARGIGAETARKMAAAGATVVIGDVLADRTRETAKEIAETGGKALALTLDVTTEGSWTAAVAATTKKFAKLDILVNNAGA